MRHFFTVNATVITFAQGVVFFALGFSVWLQRRRATRLTLSSSLIWLATFAFVESIATWGKAFIPIQARSGLDPSFVQVLVGIRCVLQIIAFVFLLEFGLRLAPLATSVRRALTTTVVLIALALVTVNTILATARGWSLYEWEGSIVAGGRYGLLLPGALLSAVGVWRQGSELVAVGMRGIKGYADAAGWMLVVFGVISGLIVDPGPWSPPGIATDDGWFSATGVPIGALRALTGLALATFAIKLLDIFELEQSQRIAALERARLIAEERARFGQDLHDGTIQSIYASGLQLESVALRAGDPAVRADVRRVVGDLNETIVGIRDYIDALHTSPAHPQAVARALEALARKFSAETGMVIRFDAVGMDASGLLPDDIGHQTEQILREALSNAARHGKSRAVDVQLTFAPDEFDLVVDDDGVGLPPPADGGLGHGLANMRDRARRLGGRVAVSTRSAGGTRVSLAVPLDSEQIPVTIEEAAHADRAPFSPTAEATP